MSFHKDDHNKFITAGNKLDTKIFESVTNFFEAQFNMNNNEVCLNPWCSSKSRNALTSSSKPSFAIRFVQARTSVKLTRQSTRLLHATPNAALTMIGRKDIDRLIAIATASAPTTTNVKQQSNLVSSTPAIATGRMTVATISL
jgi:hypothetical protein